VAFLRVKAARGRPYGYLVENQWDTERGQSRQRVVRYLGRLDLLEATSLPAEYRTPEILRQLARRVARERQRLADRAAGLRDPLERALLQGRTPEVRRLVRSAVRELGLDLFLDRVLPDVMHRVGEGWADGTVTVSQEHLATGLIARLLTDMSAGAVRGDDGPEVILCVPDGEDHTLPLLIAERLLRSKGYRPTNVGGSAPVASVANLVLARRPNAVLISVTRASRLEGAEALARRLRREVPGLRIAIGGQAVERSWAGRESSAFEVVRGPLAEFLRGWPDGAPRTG